MMSQKSKTTNLYLVLCFFLMGCLQNNDKNTSDLKRELVFDKEYKHVFKEIYFEKECPVLENSYIIIERDTQVVYRRLYDIRNPEKFLEISFYNNGKLPPVPMLLRNKKDSKFVEHIIDERAYINSKVKETRLYTLDDKNLNGGVLFATKCSICHSQIKLFQKSESEEVVELIKYYYTKHNVYFKDSINEFALNDIFKFIKSYRGLDIVASE